MKLTHDRWTGSWTITAVVTPGLCYRVTLQERRDRARRVASSHIKLYHLRPQSLRHIVGDEYFTWGPDLGLAAASTLASPIYTLVNRYPIQLPNGSWEWRYRGRYLNGSLSGFITVNPWTALHPYSWTCSTLCGRYINRSTTGPDTLQSQPAVNTSQLTEHMLC